EGRFYRAKITFPEGATIKQMSAQLERAGICSQEEYLKVVKNPHLFQRTWLVGIDSMEGYLFPDTYYLSPHTDPRQIAESQLKRFEELYPGRLQEENSLEIYKKVILASIVEREAKVAAEKPLIASV